MKELQGSQYSLAYVIKYKQTSIRIFIDNEAALQALKVPDKCFVTEIIKTTTLHLDTLETLEKSVSFY